MLAGHTRQAHAQTTGRLPDIRRRNAPEATDAPRRNSRREEAALAAEARPPSTMCPLLWGTASGSRSGATSPTSPHRASYHSRLALRDSRETRHRQHDAFQAASSMMLRRGQTCHGSFLQSSAKPELIPKVRRDQQQRLDSRPARSTALSKDSVLQSAQSARASSGASSPAAILSLAESRPASARGCTSPAPLAAETSCSWPAPRREGRASTSSTLYDAGGNMLSDTSWSGASGSHASASVEPASSDCETAPTGDGRRARAASDELAAPAAGADDEPELQLRRVGKCKSRLYTRRCSEPLERMSPQWLRTSRRSAPELDWRPAKDIRFLEAEEKIFDLYSWHQVLQEEGDGGKVVVCRPKVPGELSPLPCQSGSKFVLKMRSKQSLLQKRIEGQFRQVQLALLNMPPHPGIVPLREILEDSKFYYIVMEKANGGGFFEGLFRDFEDGTMPPDAVRRLLVELLEAVGHVHEMGLLHRDIKPDNLVMRFVEDPPSPKGSSGRRVALIDFDNAEPIRTQQGEDPARVERGAYCGTYRFSAPETFRGYFSRASDLFSVGVILYMLMTGGLPYEDELYAELYQKGLTDDTLTRMADRMKLAQIDWERSPWPEQAECREFCQMMLDHDPSRRFASAEHALAHAWLRSETKS